jgi:hypothetical protein
MGPVFNQSRIRRDAAANDRLIEVGLLRHNAQAARRSAEAVFSKGGM